MARLKSVSPESANGKLGALFGHVESRLGMIPNFFKTLANSPAALDMAIKMIDALDAGALEPRLRERIAIEIAELNGSRYCLAAHSAVGRTLGLSDEEILDCRRGDSPDRRVDAVLRFVRQVVENSGRVPDEAIDRVRSAGYTDGEITEIVSSVALNILSNYVNLVAETPVDYPDGGASDGSWEQAAAPKGGAGGPNEEKME
jgi:uncharacterized peroxidase-related enzyme